MTEGFFDRRLLICAVASVVAHALFSEALQQLPPTVPFAPPPRVTVRVIEPEKPPPPPDPPPELPQPPPPPKEPPKVVHERPAARPIPAQPQVAAPKDTPPPDHAPTTTDTTTTPVFGVNMESTSQAGTGPAVPVGNTTRPTPRVAPSASPPKQLAAPVAAYEVTKMPLPQGRCSGKYTDEARAAAVEGVVVLDLTVDATGHARDIQVVSGLPHGLTQAAITALTTCTFTPGEKSGAPVAVRLRGFKIRFLLDPGA